MQKSKLAVWGVLTIAVKRRVMKSKGERDVSSRIFAGLSQGASGVEVGEEGVGDKQ